MDPVTQFETALATVTAGHAATVTELRRLADRLERLALDDPRCAAALALERAPAGS